MSTWKKVSELYKETSGGKLDTYFKFKTSFKFEEYLNLKSYSTRKVLAKFRISDHSLRIETGRYEKKLDEHGKAVILPRSERSCQFCINASNVLDDEIHFLFVRPFNENTRKLFFKDLFDVNSNLKLLNHINLFIWLMSNEDHKILLKLSNYINLNFSMRKGKLS